MLLWRLKVSMSPKTSKIPPEETCHQIKIATRKNYEPFWNIISVENAHAHKLYIYYHSMCLGEKRNILILYIICQYLSWGHIRLPCRFKENQVQNNHAIALPYQNFSVWTLPFRFFWKFVPRGSFWRRTRKWCYFFDLRHLYQDIVNLTKKMLRHKKHHKRVKYTLIGFSGWLNRIWHTFYDLWHLYQGMKLFTIKAYFNFFGKDTILPRFIQ